MIEGIKLLNSYICHETFVCRHNLWDVLFTYGESLLGMKRRQQCLESAFARSNYPEDSYHSHIHGFNYLFANVQNFPHTAKIVLSYIVMRVFIYLQWNILYTTYLHYMKVPAFHTSMNLHNCMFVFELQCHLVVWLTINFFYYHIYRSPN